MKRVLAADGGQSAIRLRHSDMPQPIVVDGVSRREGDTVGAVTTAVARGWQLAGAPPTDRVMLGLTTAPTDEPSRRRLCSEAAASVAAAQVWLTDDADAAIERELPDVHARSADGSPLDGALLLGQERHPGPYGDLVFTWGATA